MDRTQEETTAADAAPPPSAPSGWVDKLLVVLTPDVTAGLNDADKGELARIRQQRAAELTTGGAPLKAADISHLRRIGESVTDKSGRPVVSFTTSGVNFGGR